MILERKKETMEDRMSQIDFPIQSWLLPEALVVSF